MDSKKQQFHLFLNNHIGIIRKLCRAYSNSNEDFEDYVQEVCYQLWKSLDNIRGESASSTWVYRITLNVCLTMLKKSKKLTIIPTEEKFITSEIEKNQNSNHEERQINLLYDSITKLTPIDRAIIMLYLDKKNHEDIAEIMGLSIANVGVKIFRIKKQIKKIIDERDAGHLE